MNGDQEKSLIEWEAIEDMIDALKALVYLKMDGKNTDIEDIYSYLDWASSKAYNHRKELKKYENQ